MGMFPYIDKGNARRTVQSRKAENKERKKMSERKEWTQWHCLEMPCTLFSYRFDNNSQERTFTTIRELMTYVRESYPNREWKSIKINSYGSYFYEIKYTRMGA